MLNKSIWPSAWTVLMKDTALQTPVVKEWSCLYNPYPPFVHKAQNKSWVCATYLHTPFNNPSHLQLRPYSPDPIYSRYGFTFHAAKKKKVIHLENIFVIFLTNCSSRPNVIRIPRKSQVNLNTLFVYQLNRHTLVYSIVILSIHLSDVKGFKLCFLSVSQVLRF